MLSNLENSVKTSDILKRQRKIKTIKFSREFCLSSDQQIKSKNSMVNFDQSSPRDSLDFLEDKYIQKVRYEEIHIIDEILDELIKSP